MSQEKDKKLSKKSRSATTSKKADTKDGSAGKDSTINGGEVMVDLPGVDDALSGFKKGYEAEEIVGATEMNDQILFLIKWSVLLKVLGLGGECSLNCVEMIARFTMFF